MRSLWREYIEESRHKRRRKECENWCGSLEKAGTGDPSVIDETSEEAWAALMTTKKGYSVASHNAWGLGCFSSGVEDEAEALRLLRPNMSGV